MNFNRDYWIEFNNGQHITAEDISHFNIVDGMLYFYRGLNVILAVPVCNLAYFGGKDRVRT